MIPLPNSKPKRVGRGAGAGAKKGNTNSLKHGLYSRRFKTLEVEDLQHVKEGSLVDEVVMLRVCMRRVFEYMDGITERLDDGSPESEVRTGSLLIGSLASLGIATTRLSHMLRTQKILDGDTGSSLETMIELAQLELQNSLGIGVDDQGVA